MWLFNKWLSERFWWRIGLEENVRNMNEVKGKHTFLRWLETFSIQMNYFGVCLQQIVSAQVFWNTGEVHGWCHDICTISLITNVPWFIYCRPNLFYLCPLHKSKQSKIKQNKKKEKRIKNKLIKILTKCRQSCAKY